MILSAKYELMRKNFRNFAETEFTTPRFRKSWIKRADLIQKCIRKWPNMVFQALRFR